MPRRCCGTEPALQGGPDAPFSGAREPGHWHRPVGGKPATPLSKDESLRTLPRRPRSSPPTTAGDGSGPPRGRPTAHPNKMAASPTVWLLTNAPLCPDRKGGEEACPRGACRLNTLLPAELLEWPSSRQQTLCQRCPQLTKGMNRREKNVPADRRSNREENAHPKKKEEKLPSLGA